MNKADAQKRIRQAAAAGAVIYTTHAQQRMRERDISRAMVAACLQWGRIYREPEPNIAKGSTECRVEHYSAGVNYAVIAAIYDDQPNTVVVTVMEI